MSWLSKATGIHVHVDPVQVVKDAVSTAANVAQTAAEAAVKVAVAPAVVLVAASEGDLKKIETTVKDMVGSVSTTASALAEAASTPYILAADITSQVGGDGAKIIRGVIAQKLVEINLVPYILEVLEKGSLKDPQEIAETIASAPLAAILAAYLKAAQDILAPAASPIPNTIRKLLMGHYPEDVLNGTKYIVSAFGLTLPEVVNGSNVFMGQHAFAVTVGNVIVFSETPASDDAGIFWWAHEMQHAAQYARLGIAGFADAYVKNYKSLESEADDKGREVVST